MNDFTRCPGCRLIRPEGEGLCPACSGAPEIEQILSNPDPAPEPFRPAEPYRPDQARGEGPAQSVLPMPDAGPLFAGCLEAKS